MSRDAHSPTATAWPPIPYDEWADTCATLHLWNQVVGKVRLALTPWLNHSWHAVSYLTPRGWTTGTIPYEEDSFAIDFDFVSHELRLARSDGSVATLALRPQAVAEFYAEVMGALGELGVEVRIDRFPNEVEDPILLHEDRVHRSYDADAAHRFWRATLSSHRVLEEFRTGFLGKVSPTHLFWGSFDLAVTRFSGRKAPLHPGGTPGLPDAVSREAYSHEVSSAGFWPGQGLGYPAYYSYAYPEPDGFAEARVGPEGAFYNPDFGQFNLPYDAVRTAPDPKAALLEFLEDTYRAAADLGNWDRAPLECPRGRPGVPRPVG